MIFINQDFLPRLRAKQEKREMLEDILGAITLAVGGYVMIILISFL